MMIWNMILMYVCICSMVDDPSSDDLIRWADDGMSFLVLRHEDFAKRVLPRFFKHSNFSSFVRQLNMYGFHKVPHLQQGVLHADSDAERWEFSNPHFQRNQPDLLLLVTRKKGRDTEEKETGNIDMHNILDEIAAIKKHQMSISADLKGIQRDNQVLWQETLAARERHHRHQETIDKILRFLASVFSSDKKRVVIPRKRRMLIGDANTEYKDEDFLEEEEEDDRPAKVARHFNIDEYINGNQGNLSSSSTGLPYTGNADDALANAASSDAPATELAAAIALNDETKQQQKQLQQQQQQQQMQMSVSHLPPSTEGKFDLFGIEESYLILIYPLYTGTAPSQQHHQQPDLSSTLNFQQLQSIIALVQANPALLSQLGGDALFNPHIPQQVDYNGASFNDDSKPSTQQLTSPSPTPVQSTYPVSTVTPLTSSSPSLPQVTNNITTVAKSADAINQDIDALGASLGLLASQLGFDPSKADFGSINMDDFLNTGK